MPQRTPLKSTFEAAAETPGDARFKELRETIEAAAKNGHVLLGEPHGEDMNLNTYRFLAANPELFQNMAQYGAKHLVLEFPNEFEGKLEPFIKGEMNVDQLQDSLFNNPDLELQNLWSGEKYSDFQHAFVQTLDNAHKAGMKIHFADVTASSFINAQGDVAQEIRSGSISPKDARNRTSGNIWDRADDSEQHAFVRDRIPINDKIMGCFGVVHVSSPEIPLNGLNTLFGDPKGIADRLRAEQGIPVTTVGLWANREQEQNVLSGEAHFKIINGMKGTNHSAYFDTKDVEARVKAQSPSPAPQANGPEYTGPGFGGM